MVAINSAMAVLGWMELSEEEVPPRRFWHNEERLREWFDSVQQRREDRASGQDYEAVPDGDDGMTTNEAASGLR